MSMKYAHTALSMTTCLLLITSIVGCGQRTKQQSQLPIIDMHEMAMRGRAPGPYQGMQAAESSERLFEEMYERFRRFNIVKAVVCGTPGAVKDWKSKDKDGRIIQGVYMEKPDNWGMNPTMFEDLVKSGRVEFFGEVNPLVEGMTVCDPNWQPYLKICEKYDIPMMLHVGRGPTYRPKARMRLGEPYLVEEVFIKYPKLRVCLAHAGTEYHEQVLMLMDGYQQVYTHLSGILFLRQHQRYAREFLAKAKEDGQLKKVMFAAEGQFYPDAVERALNYLNSLDFLTEQDKRDILYNNAARFLKLKE